MKKTFIKYAAIIITVIMLTTVTASALGYTPAEKAQLRFNKNGELNSGYAGQYVYAEY